MRCRFSCCKTKDEMTTSQGSSEDSRTLKTIGWLSVGVGAVALGVFIGRELRNRYKFNRRTPYDFYAHSGDGSKGLDYGVGI